MSQFKLYPEEKHWWSFLDYKAVLDLVQEHQAQRVLEFGPGSSTLSLIEGGAVHVDTCEDDPDWADVYDQRLVALFPELVHLHRYTWSATRLTIPALKDSRYDLALIDGPRESTRRTSALNFALDRCPVVVLADMSPPLWKRVEALVTKGKYTVERRETGPLAGTFTILRRVV
jgi:hypothetical protein